VPGEFGGREPHATPGIYHWVIVRQVSPGVRVRVFFRTHGWPVFTEAAAEAIFNRLMQRSEARRAGARGHA
jgi:hypothetical protein